VNNFYERLAHCQTVEERHFEQLINWKNGDRYHKKYVSLTHAYSQTKVIRIRPPGGATQLDNANTGGSVTFKPHNSRFT